MSRAHDLPLPQKVLLASVAALVVFSLASFASLYRAQSELATREMDAVLENEALSLSSLVNAWPGGRLDFELSPKVLATYRNPQSPGFFRYFLAGERAPLRESGGAPSIECARERPPRTIPSAASGATYRVLSLAFVPEPDEDAHARAPFERPEVCLVVGLDQAPYRAMVMKSLLSIIPQQIAILIGALLLLAFGLRSMTSDLSRLTETLAISDFAATREFPKLPTPKTPELRTIVEKLEALHGQAREHDRETWLFLARASHQLKTPVTAILASVQVLLRRERSKEELVYGLRELEAATQNLSRITRQLVSSSRLAASSPGEKESVRLPEFFSAQLQLFHALAASRDIALELQVPASDLSVMAAPSLLGEIFSNLIENAILYSRPGGKVLIRCSREGQDILVSIMDRGRGFPENVRERLFEPFVRGDEREIGGSGLGLSIAARATQILGGRIRLASSGPDGSQVDVLLRPDAGTT